MKLVIRQDNKEERKEVSSIVKAIELINTIFQLHNRAIEGEVFHNNVMVAWISRAPHSVERWREG